MRECQRSIPTHSLPIHSMEGLVLNCQPNHCSRPTTRCIVQRGCVRVYCGRVRQGMLVVAGRGDRQRMATVSWHRIGSSRVQTLVRGRTWPRAYREGEGRCCRCCSWWQRNRRKVVSFGRLIRGSSSWLFCEWICSKSIESI